MIKRAALITLFSLLAFQLLDAQSIESLRQQINQILESKSAKVGVAIRGVDPKDTLSINGDRHLPMQSVYKYHLALAVLHQVDQGKLNLEDTISIDQETINSYKDLWSPLNKKYPESARITMSEILEYTVSLSDNMGCDLLFELVGGTEVVDAYLHQIGITNIAVVHTEMVMQSIWDSQYDNWTTAKAANWALQLFFENANELLSDKSYQFLLSIMKNTKTGQKSIKGNLPTDVIVAHKTGYSGVNSEGLTGALNDIGIVFLPNDSHFYISVLVSNSMEDYDTNQKIIADIAKVAWDYFNR